MTMLISNKLKITDYLNLFFLPIFIFVIGLICIIKYPEIPLLPHEKVSKIQSNLERIENGNISECDQLYLRKIVDTFKSQIDLMLSQREIFRLFSKLLISLSLFQILINIALCIKIKKIQSVRD